MSKHLRQTVTNTLLRDKWLKSEHIDPAEYWADYVPPSIAELRAKSPDHIRQKHLAFKLRNTIKYHPDKITP